MDKSSVKSDQLSEAREALDKIAGIVKEYNETTFRVGSEWVFGNTIQCLRTAVENLVLWAENVERQQLNH